MKSEYPFPHEPCDNKPEVGASSSRLLDEKVSDESGAEAKSDSALAPAGLDNPFWN